MNKNKNFLIVCLLVMVTAFFAVPNAAKAFEDPKKPKATNIHYYPSDSASLKDRTGIKSFTLDPYTYYNLSKDTSINPTQSDTIVLDNKTIKNIAKNYLFPKWSVIADSVFKDQASQLVTIKGSGLMKSDQTSSQSFDRHFNTSKAGVSGYNYKWSVGDLAYELRQEGTYTKGKVLNDEFRREGIKAVGSLNDARTLMGQSLRNCSDDNDNTVDDFLGNSYQKTDNEYRLPALDDDKTGSGYCNVVTCINQAAVNDYDYVTFGLCIYDFDITPVAAKDLKYIEAAQKLDNGEQILMGTGGPGDPAVGVTFSNSSREGSKSILKNATASEATQSAGLETSVTEENTISRDDTYEWGMEQTLGVEWNIGGFGLGDKSAMFPRVTLSASNSWHELWSTTKSNSQTKSVTKTKNINTELTLPPDTVATINQNIDNKSVEEDYQQPVILNYKVALFAMSGDFYNGTCGGIKPSTYDKQWMSVIFDGSDDNKVSGCDALGGLYRSVTDGTSRYDTAKGKLKSWCDKGAFTKSEGINWSNVASNIADDNRGSRHIVSSETGKKATLEQMAKEMLLIEKAHTLESRQQTSTASVDQILPLKPLKAVSLKNPQKSFTVNPGDRFYLDNLELEATDTNNIEFYNFDDEWGQWYLLNNSGDIIEDEDGDGITTNGNVTLHTDDTLNSQWVETNESGNVENQKIKWVLDEDAKICSNEQPTGMTKEEIKALNDNNNTPAISLSAIDETKNLKEISVTGEFKEPYTNEDDEPYNLNSYFKAKAIDSTGKKSNVQIFWEGDGDDDFEVNENGNGDIKFSKPGEYNVRPYCYDIVSGNKKKITTKDNVFITVKAMDKARLNRISFRLPDDLDEEHTTLTNKNHSLGFDLDTYVKMYDQYDEDWTGDKPEIRFTVTDKNGEETSDASIDHENILTVTGAGKYKVTAKAYDADGEELPFSIDPISLVITEDDWLDQIIFNDPALSKDQLSIKEIDGEVKIENLKNQLEYVDQNNHEWKGSKPRVEFYLADTTSNAEIKGDSFFAYAPGTYDIVAITADYEIDPISVTIYEKSENMIKTVDPDDLKITELTADGAYENVEYDLMRSVDYTTRFGGKWNDKYPKPAVKFTLDESTPGATITDNNKFRTNKPGKYTIHVEPKKHSEYPDKSIDDIEVNVILDRHIEFVLMDFRMIPSSERRISDDLCVVSDLEQYVRYQDQFGYTFKKSDLENYKYELPKITGFVFASDVPEYRARIDKSYDTSKSDYYYYLTAQSPGDYEVKPVYDEGSVGDDLSFVSGALHILNKNEDDVVEGKVYSKIGSGDDLTDEQADRYFAAFVALDDLYSDASPADYSGDAADPSSDRAKVAAIIDEAANSIVSTYNDDSVSDEDAALQYNQSIEAAKEKIDKFKTTAQTQEDQAKARNVSIMINALMPESPNYVQDVIAASEAFEALTDDQKKLVDAKYKNILEQAENTVKEEIRLTKAKKKAISEIEETDLSVYDPKEREEVTYLIDKAKNSINNAESVDAVSMYQEFFTDCVKMVATKTDKEIDKASADLNAAKAVMAMVDALPEDLGTDEEDAVKAVYDAYEALTDDQKEYFDAGYYSRLSKAKESVRNVRDAIEWLQAFPDKLDISDNIMVVLTDYMFFELTDTEISHVYNIQVYEDSKEAMKVIKMISALKSPENITKDDKEYIESARRAYNSLTDDQKNRVSDVIKEKLTSTEKVFALINEGSQDQNVINVLELISKVPDKMQASDGNALQAAVTAFEALDNDQKNAVNAVTSKLTESRAAMPVVEAIEQLNEKVGFANTETVRNVINDYKNLTPQNAKHRIYQNLMNKLEDCEDVAGVVELISEIPENPLDGEDKVTAAADAYDDLADYQLAYMDDACKTKLDNARQAVQTAKSQAEIQDVINMIDSLTEESTKEEIQTVRLAYDELSDDQKDSVTNYNKLKSAEEALEQKELDELKQEAVNDLDNIDTTKYSGEELNSATESINAGKTLVNLSTSKDEVEFFKGLVNGVVSALMTDEDKSAAEINSVRENIAKIPENVTMEDQDVVAAARTAYDELKPEQKKQIDSSLVNKLVSAENTIKKEAADKDAADKVIQAIKKIPADPKAEDLPAIKAAQDAYNALSEEQKALVGKDAVEKLNNAKKTAEKDKGVKDKAAADKVSEMINKLPADPTIDDEKQVTDAMNAFNALTDEQKALIPDAQKNKLMNADKQMELSKAKTKAIEELNNIDLSKYDDAGRQAVSKIISEAKKDIEKAATAGEVESAMKYARSRIALVKTSKQKKAQKIKTIKVNTKTVNAKAINKAVKKAGGKAAYITKIILGKKVKKIKKNSFKKYKKVKTLEIKTKKLKKKAVKGSLRGSKIKTIKVKAGSKKVNKKYIKKYKKIFTKKNAGKKVKVR